MSIEEQKAFLAIVEAGFDLIDVTDWYSYMDFCGEVLALQWNNVWNYDLGRRERYFFILLEVNMVCGGKIECQYWHTEKFLDWKDALKRAKEIIEMGESFPPMIEFKNDPRSDLSKGRY